MFYLRTLDDTTWSIADVTGPIGTGTHIFDINFTANDQEYSSIRFVDGVDSGKIYFGATLVNEYPQGGWVNTAYQNVKIAGGVDATNPSLLSWFRQNAKNLTPSNDDASITDALRNIADAISSGGGAGGLPSTEEASVGDVLSLDEDKKPTWAAPNGGDGVVILTPPSHEVVYRDGSAFIGLCSMSELMSMLDPDTNAFTKACFVNVPYVEVGQQAQSWDYIIGFFLLTGADWTAKMDNSTNVTLAFSESDVLLEYMPR